MKQFANDQVVVGLGTDSDRDTNMHRVLDLLADRFGDLILSSIYECRPVDSRSVGSRSVDNRSIDKSADDNNAPDYWNAVVGFHYAGPMSELNAILKSIENTCGRDRQQERVAMDIDILFFGNRVGEFEGVVLPRQGIEQCVYALRPLAELFPETQYPGSEQVFEQYWDAMDDKAQLHPIDFVWRQQVVSVAPPCLSM